MAEQDQSQTQGQAQQEDQAEGQTPDLESEFLAGIAEEERAAAGVSPSELDETAQAASTQEPKDDQADDSGTGTDPLQEGQEQGQEPTEDTAQGTGQQDDSKPKETNWETRYRDLQSHTTRQMDELRKQLEELKAGTGKDDKGQEPEDILKGFEEELSENEKELLGEIPELQNVLRKALAKVRQDPGSSQEVQQLRYQVGLMQFDQAVREKHPDWRKVTQTPKWQQWAMSLPLEEYRECMGTQDPAVATKYLDRYKAAAAEAAKDSHTQQTARKKAKQDQSMPSGPTAGRGASAPKGQLSPEEEFEAGIREEEERERREAGTMAM